MMRLIWITCFSAILSANAYAYSYYNPFKCFNFMHYARCQEIKKRIVYFDGGNYSLNNANNTQMLNAEHDAQLENLNRAYRANGC